MSKDYLHFPNKLHLMKWAIEQGASIDLNATMKMSASWFVDKDGSVTKSVRSVDFLQALNDKYNLNIDVNKSLFKGFKLAIIFLKDTPASEDSIVEIQTDETEEVVEEVKSTKRTRKAKSEA